MKSILTISIILLSLSVEAQKTIDWVNLESLYDTSSMTLKPGAHTIIARIGINRKIRFDSVKIQIMPDTSTFEVNYMPVAFAGNDTTWTLGKTATVKGSGQDADGTITAYKWTKLKGPQMGKISYSTRATTTLTGLVKGDYTYQLKVTDNNGGFALDTVKITVQ